MTNAKPIRERIGPPRLLGHLTDDGLRNIEGPVIRYTNRAFPMPIADGLSREGLSFRSVDVDAYAYQFNCQRKTENGFMNIIESLRNSYDECETLWSRYRDKLVAFRSAVKNDCASLEAVANKTTQATLKMNKAYGDVIAQMNSADMAKAIENAERLAAAMTALANLQSHRLVLAVTDQSKPEA